MRKAIALGAIIVGLSFVTVGCTTIRSSRGGSSGMANDLWFTETYGIPLIPFSTRVYYCPPMSNSGPSTCTEAEMVEDPKAAPQKTREPAPAAPTQEVPPESVPDEEGAPDMEGEFPPG